MKVTKEELLAAAARVGVSSEQSASMWRELEIEKEHTPGFRPSHVAYYFGALIVIGAMGWFMTTAWESLGGWGIAGIAIGYAFMFVLVGHKFWQSPDTHIPGGLLITIAVCMTPLAVYGIERALNLWPATAPASFAEFHPYIKACWVIMELCTVAVGFIALLFYEFPFLTAPIAYALWYMSMDVTALIYRNEWRWEDEAVISVVFGAAMMLVAYFYDRKKSVDYSFWGYFFGAICFWGGLSSMNSNSELSKFFYLLINLAMIVVAILLGRKIFIVLGSLGVFGYLGHLAYSVFKDSVMFPFVLSVIGILVIYLGIKYQKNHEQIDNRLRGFFGKTVRA